MKQRPRFIQNYREESLRRLLYAAGVMLLIVVCAIVFRGP